MFFIAAADTSTAALCYFAYNLAINVDVQEKIVDEVVELSTDGKIEFDCVFKMTYLEACLFESLRLMPPLPRVERQAMNDCQLGDLFVPKGTYVSIPTYAVHHDPNNFEDPEKFKPERFLPENKHKIMPGTFLPFADGPRNCIGMRFALAEIKYCIANMLLHYKLTACAHTTVSLLSSLQNSIMFLLLGSRVLYWTTSYIAETNCR